MKLTLSLILLALPAITFAKGRIVYEMAEAIIKIAKAGKKVKVTELSRNLERIPASSHNLVKSLAKRNPEFVSVICRSDTALNYTIKNPNDFNSFLHAWKSTGGGQYVLRMFNGLKSGGYQRAIDDLVPKLNKAEIDTLTRSLEGKTYSSEKLKSIVDKTDCWSSNTTLRGDFFEFLGEKILSSRPPQGLNLKKGAKIIDGKFSGTAGIDRIGLDANGRPVIIELTIGNKNPMKRPPPYGPQMSPDWVSHCWNELVAKQPNKIDELIKSGMSPKYKKAFRPSDFEGDSLFVRKFVVPQGGKVSNIQGLGLSNINDRIEL